MHATHRFNLDVTLAAAALAVVLPFVAARADIRSDAAITIKAKAALESVELNRASSVHVSTIDGRVTLFGRIRSASEKAEASARMWPIAGVVEVDNFLQIVVPGTKDPAVRRGDDVVLADVRRVYSNISDIDALAPAATVSSVQLAPLNLEDERMRRDVMKALEDLDARANADIHVVVKDGVVWLTGTVPSWDGNATRLYAVRSVTGVRSITNALRVAAPIVAVR
jgi:osmotically-inducible protein OsmY